MVRMQQPIVPYTEQLDSVIEYCRKVIPPEPLSGAANSPEFKPQDWNNFVMASCLRYAANSKGNTEAVPGYLNVAKSPETKCRVYNNLIKDGFKPAPYQEKGKFPPDVKGYYLVALFLCPNHPDFFHFYRKDKKGWSEKFPGMPPSNHDDYRVIKDPRKAKYYSHRIPKYEFVAFLYAPCPGISLSGDYNNAVTGMASPITGGAASSTMTRKPVKAESPGTQAESTDKKNTDTYANYIYVGESMRPHP